MSATVVPAAELQLQRGASRGQLGISASGILPTRGAARARVPVVSGEELESCILPCLRGPPRAAQQHEQLGDGRVLLDVAEARRDAALEVLERSAQRLGEAGRLMALYDSLLHGERRSATSSAGPGAGARGAGAPELRWA